jgi:hypothetical protein
MDFQIPDQSKACSTSSSPPHLIEARANTNARAVRDTESRM